MEYQKPHVEPPIMRARCTKCPYTSNVITPDNYAQIAADATVHGQIKHKDNTTVTFYAQAEE